MINIAIAQMKILPGQIERNMESIRHYIAEAKNHHSDILIFPELCISGAALGDVWHQKSFLDALQTAGEEIAKLSENLTIIFGNAAILEENNQTVLYNAVFVAQNRKFISPKHHLHPFQIKTWKAEKRYFDENCYFSNLRDYTFDHNLSLEEVYQPFEIVIKDEMFSFIPPINLCPYYTPRQKTDSINLFFSSANFYKSIEKYNLTIIQELDFFIHLESTTRSVKEDKDTYGENYSNFSQTFNYTPLQETHCHKSMSEALQMLNIQDTEPFSSVHKDVILTNTEYTTGFSNNTKITLNKNPLYEKACPIPLLHIQGCGIENTGKTFYALSGVTLLHLPNQPIMKLGNNFEEGLHYLTYEKKPSHRTIKILPAPDTSTISNTQEVTHPSYVNQLSLKQKNFPTTLSLLESEVEEGKKIYELLHFALQEILLDLGITKIVIGISGGIDSAVAAALYSTVISPENLYLVSMPSKFNSTLTQQIGKEIAENIGCHYAVCPIGDLLTTHIKEFEKITFTRCQETSKLHIADFVKENMQARDRSSRILAGIAAAVGGVFTCNGNKTELSTGYVTLYGDLAGFLAAAGDLWKDQVYALGKYLNYYVHDYPILPEAVFTIKPSAELSQNHDISKGLGDPLQYPYHDRLFKAFVENHETPESLAQSYINQTIDKILDLKAPLHTYFKSPQEFFEDLEKWWDLYSGFAIAKRIQSPPVISISDLPYGAKKESQIHPIYTKNYINLKEFALTKKI